MSLPITRTTSNATGGTVNSNIVAMDYWTSPFNISIQVLVTGTVTYTVQYTFDNVQADGWIPSTGNWTNHPQMTAKTATLDSNIAYPVTAIRVQQTAGSGSTLMTVIAAGGGAN